MEIKSSFLRQRGKNYNVYIEYVDEEGKLRQKSIAKYISKKEAEKHLIELKCTINNNKFIVPKNITFVDRYIKYINDPSKDFSPNTLKTRKAYLDKNIRPFFKDLLLKDITPAILQEYANCIYREYTKASATHRLVTVKVVLNEAYRLKEINENPCDFIKAPKALKPNKNINNPYDREEIKHITECLKGELIEMPILLMLSCGLRVGEVGGLRWRDIDFENNTISINQVLIYPQSREIHFRKPKTHGSIRTISAPMELISKLKKIKVQHNEYKLQGVLEYEELICLNSKLKPWIETSLAKAYVTFVKKYNIRRIRLHDLRHTHATMLVLAGVDFKTISNRLGHTNIDITLNRYSHVLKEMDTKASDRISDLMFK